MQNEIPQRISFGISRDGADNFNKDVGYSPTTKAPGTAMV
jgi:hypothetical protein